MSKNDVKWKDLTDEQLRARLKLAGWNCFYIALAVLYRDHDFTVPATKKGEHWPVLTNWPKAIQGILNLFGDLTDEQVEQQLAARKIVTLAG
jgi:hypothetical protein